MDLVPPDDLIKEHSGGMERAEFISTGDSIVRGTLIENAKLKPFQRILDMGCGCGKLARPLTKYLSPAGRYDGVDIGASVVEWCTENYRKFPNFHFHHADLHSKRYTPEGRQQASTYIFPFENDQFDVVFLASVFTHMLPDAVDNYLKEIHRVLKPNGVCIATYFILDDESRRNSEAGRTNPRFAYRFGHAGCWIEVPEIPEAAVAYEDALLRQMHAKNGLAIETVAYGQWGRGQFVPMWQDEVWCRREATR